MSAFEIAALVIGWSVALTLIGVGLTFAFVRYNERWGRKSR